MKQLFSTVWSLLLTSIAVQGQCVPGVPCDDADPCTSGDIYTVIPGELVCGPGTAEFPNPSSNSDWSSLSPEDQRVVSPFMHDLPGRRFRKQYMFLASELDVQVNQMAGNVFATNGLGACEPVTAIAFYIEVPVTAADQKLWQFAITLKHAPSVMNNTSLGFDNSIDPDAGCASSSMALVPDVSAQPGWFTIALSSSFQWDGVRDVILEVAATIALDQTSGVLPIRFVAIAGNAPFNQLTRSSYTEAPYPPPGDAPCSPTTPTTSLCGPVNPATAMGNCDNFGSSNLRPSVLFIGGVTTADPPDCLCTGVVLDTDEDGIIDCEDLCPLGLNPGDPCDDGDELTIGDTVGEDCECLGLAMGVDDAVEAPPAHVWPVPCGSVLFLDRTMSGLIIDGIGRQVLVFNKASRLDVGHLPAGPYLLRDAEQGLVRFVKD